jgi:transposase InsO family protein
VTKDDVLFGYRQQLFAEAARTSVSAACRTFGVHRSTFYAWKRQVDRHGLEMLRPRERRRPQMPNQLPKMVEERIVSFSLAHPGLGPKRVASDLAREKWGAIIVSPNGVWKVLCRHGLNTRAKRLGLIAGYAAPYEPPRDPGPEQHIDVGVPGELVGMDCFYVGRLKGTNGAIWQLTAIDVASSFAWAELVVCPQDNPTAEQTSRLARRVASDLKAAGWRLQRVISDNGNEFRGLPFGTTLERIGARHSRIHAGRPQTNGNVEAHVYIGQAAHCSGTGAATETNAGQVPGSSLVPGPPTVPDRGSLRYGGRAYQAVSFTAEGFPAGPLRISLLVADGSSGS